MTKQTNVEIRRWVKV